MSGLFRDVYLYSMPSSARIVDFSWRANAQESANFSTVFVGALLEWNSLAAVEDGDWSLVFNLYYEGILLSSTMRGTGQVLNGQNIVNH